MKQVWLRNGQLDISRQIFVRDGQRPRPVRELEAKLLSYLAARPNRVIPYAELLVEVWGYRPEHPPGVIHTTVRRLRKVIGDSARSPQHIFNVRGEGFRFVPAMARPEDTMLPAESASPADPDPIIGRTQALDTLATLVAANPLVSVVGVGGVGKTRLVRELMDAQISAFPEGLFFVDLTAVRDLLGSCVAVADALAVPVSQRDPIDSLGQSLADRGRVMLVLDNAETVIDELKPVAVAWAKTMAQTGGRLVLTSRRRLDVPIEQVFPLKPLQLPEPTGSAEAVATSAAGQLFLRRARARRAHLRQTPQTLSALGALLRDLDGLPLAIELAAAHARLLSPGEIHARLREAGLQDLRTGPRPDRHRSLNAALAWSWSLLDETHRAALAQCSLFEGGFTVRAAEAILQLPDPNVEVIAVIDHLVEHHLLYSAGDPPRLEMLATVRAFAVAKRTDANASSAWTPATAFARYYAAFADQPRQAGRPELGNLRVGARIGDGDAAARCALAALNLIRRAHVSEATALLKDALQRDGLSNRTHARLLDVRVSMARNLPEPPEEIRQYGQTALLLADEMGDRKLACDIEESLGAYLRSVGAVADAEAHYRRAVELAEEIEDAESIAVARTGLAMLYQHSGRRHESHTILREVLAMYEEEVDHPGREGVVLVRLGIFYQGMGRFEQARRCFQRGAERFLEEPQGAVYYASAMHNLAGITPDLEARLALLQEGEAYARRGGTPEILTMSLALQCRCLTDLGRPQQAEAKGRAALRRAERNNKVSTLGRVLYHLAPAQAALGDIDDALTTLDRSHAIFASAQDAGYVAAVAAQRGLILREAGRLGAARDAYETAIETHRALNLSRMLFGSLCGLAIVQARRGEDPSALLEEAKALLNGFELPPDSPMWQELQDAASVAIAAG